MFKKLIVIGGLLLATPVFGATICIDVPDAQMPYVQAVATREKADSAQTYLQQVVSVAIDSWQKQIDEKLLAEAGDKLKSLSPEKQKELMLILNQAVGE